MRPVPIPAGVLELWPGARRVVVGAPDGDLAHPDVAPVECIMEASAHDGPLYTLRCALEAGDLEKLIGGAHVWLTFYGHVPVFAVTVE